MSPEKNVVHFVDWAAVFWLNRYTTQSETFCFSPSKVQTISMLAGGGFSGICPKLNLFALNWFSSSWVSLLSGENRPSAASPTTPAPAGAAPKLLPNPPPAFAAEEEKLNPEADPNPEEAGGLSAAGAANEKEEAEGVEADPKPDGGFVGAVKRPPNPVDWEDVDKEPNPVAGAGKLKVWAWAGAGAPNPE